MILQTVSISAAPRELHIKLFKVHGDELEKLEKDIHRATHIARIRKKSGLHSVFYSSHLPRRIYPGDGFTV